MADSQRTRRVLSEQHRKAMSVAAKARCTPEWRNNRSERLRTKLDDDALARMYESGMSQCECAESLGVTQKVIWKALKRLGIASRRAIKRNQWREANDSWRGNDACYSAFHRRLDALFGKAQECGVCGTTDPSRTYDWANLTGRYEDVSDYKRMCRSCHWKYDKKINNIKKMRKDGVS